MLVILQKWSEKKKFMDTCEFTSRQLDSRPIRLAWTTCLLQHSYMITDLLYK